jgi:hypothetical protein
MTKENTALEAECRICLGHGHAIENGDDQVECKECEGEGWVKCDRGGIGCSYKFCYCEAAWDRRQEEMNDG